MNTHIKTHWPSHKWTAQGTHILKRLNQEHYLRFIAICCFMVSFFPVTIQSFVWWFSTEHHSAHLGPGTQFLSNFYLFNSDLTVLFIWNLLHGLLLFLLLALNKTSINKLTNLKLLGVFFVCTIPLLRLLMIEYRSNNAQHLATKKHYVSMEHLPTALKTWIYHWQNPYLISILLISEFLIFANTIVYIASHTGILIYCLTYMFWLMLLLRKIKPILTTLTHLEKVILSIYTLLAMIPGPSLIFLPLTLYQIERFDDSHQNKLTASTLNQSHGSGLIYSKTSIWNRLLNSQARLSKQSTAPLDQLRSTDLESYYRFITFLLVPECVLLIILLTKIEHPTLQYYLHDDHGLILTIGFSFMILGVILNTISLLAPSRWLWLQPLLQPSYPLGRYLTLIPTALLLGIHLGSTATIDDDLLLIDTIYYSLVAIVPFSVVFLIFASARDHKLGMIFWFAFYVIILMLAKLAPNYNLLSYLIVVAFLGLAFTHPLIKLWISPHLYNTLYFTLNRHDPGINPSYWKALCILICLPIGAFFLPIWMYVAAKQHLTSQTTPTQLPLE